MTPNKSEEWEKIVKGQVSLLIENAKGVERGEYYDFSNALQNGMCGIVAEQLAKAREEERERIAREKPSCPPHDLVPFQMPGAWSASVPPPNMKCKKCLLEARF